MNGSPGGLRASRPDESCGGDRCIADGLRSHMRGSVRRLWPGSRTHLQTNILELLMVYLTLNLFSLRLTRCHILVRMDSTARVAYINRQGGFRSAQMSTLAHRLLLWAESRPQVVYADMVLGPDLPSVRGAPGTKGTTPTS